MIEEARDRGMFLRALNQRKFGVAIVCAGKNIVAFPASDITKINKLVCLCICCMSLLQVSPEVSA